MGSLFGYEDIFIGSVTPVKDVIRALAARGCSDLTSVIDSAACSTFPLAGGGFCDVYRGTTNHDTPVAIKSLRIYDAPGKENGKEKTLKVSGWEQRAARELYHWSKLRHPNVLPLMGLALFRGRISMVSEWMENGNLPSYLSLNPSANRVCLVHGDLKGANVMISRDGIAMIADFGNSQLRDLTLRFTNTTNSNITVRWAAPELLDEESGSSLSKKTDVYAYGMTVLETLTGKVPYDEFSEHQVIVMVAFKHKTPARPVVGVDAEMWEILLDCWLREPTDRPDIASVEAWLMALYGHKFGKARAAHNKGLGGANDSNPTMVQENDYTAMLKKRDGHSPILGLFPHRYGITNQIDHRSVPKLSVSVDSMTFLDIPEELEQRSQNSRTPSDREIANQHLPRAEPPNFEVSAIEEASRREIPFIKVAPKPIPRRNRPPSLLTNLMSSVPKTYPPAAVHQHNIPGQSFRISAGGRRPLMLQTRRSTIAMPMTDSVTAQGVTTHWSVNPNGEAVGSFGSPELQNHTARGLSLPGRTDGDMDNERSRIISEPSASISYSPMWERTSIQFTTGFGALGSGLHSSTETAGQAGAQVEDSGSNGVLQSGDKELRTGHLALVQERSHIHDFHRAGW